MFSTEELMGLWEVPMMKNQTICLGRRVLEKLSHAKEDRGLAQSHVNIVKYGFSSECSD